MSFRSEINARLGWDWEAGARDNSRLEYTKELLEGYGIDQASAVWHSESRTLADGASDTFDLTDLTRAVLGDILITRLFEVQAILVVNLSTAGGILIVGNAPFDCWWEPFGATDHTVEVPLDSAVLLANRRIGWPVTPGGSSSSSSGEEYVYGESGGDRMLRITALGGEVTYSIAIIGQRTSSSSGE